MGLGRLELSDREMGLQFCAGTCGEDNGRRDAELLIC
jgi:hypothetical protein